MRARSIAFGACAIIGCGRIPIGDWDIPGATGGALQDTSGAAGTLNGEAGGFEPTGLGGHTTSAGSSGTSARTGGAAGQSGDGAASGFRGGEPGGCAGSASESDAGASGPQGGVGGGPSPSGAAASSAAAGTAGEGGVGASGTGGGATTGGSDSAGSSTGGSDTGGSSTGGAATGGSSTGGSDTGGSGTGGSDTGGSGTGGAATGGSDTGGVPSIPPEVAAWEPCSEDSAITVVAPNAEQGCWVGCTNGDVFYGGCDGTGWSRKDEPAEEAGSLPLPDGPVSTIAPLYNDSLRAYVSFVGLPSVRKIWETQTQGQTWLEHSESTTLDVWSLSYVPFATDHLHAYVVAPDGGGSHIDASNDGGSTYHEEYIADGLIGLPSGSSDLISTIAMYDYSPDHFIVGTINGNLYVTSDGTTERTFGRIGPVEMPRYPVTKIALRPYESDYELWVTFEGPLKYGIWVSTGSALIWDNAHAPGLPDGAGSGVVDGWYGVSFNPVFADTLYLFGTEGAYRSDNHGLSWTRTWPRG